MVMTRRGGAARRASVSSYSTLTWRQVSLSCVDGMSCSSARAYELMVSSISDMCLTAVLSS